MRKSARPPYLVVVVEDPVDDDLERGRHEREPSGRPSTATSTSRPTTTSSTSTRPSSASAASRAGAELARRRATSVTPRLEPAATGLTTTGWVQEYAGRGGRASAARPARWRCRPRRRRAWWPTCPSRARRRRPRTRRTGTPASSHRAASVPSSPRGPCTAGTATSQLRSTSTAPASAERAAVRVAPAAVAADGQRTTSYAGGRAPRRPPRPRRGRRRARSSRRRR